ncbi:hypothetical protein CRV24_005090 [Beauveria bassiana]|nr:hypothetical protein CRV24_005090 [Beauveria bassiana]KAH8711733.1 hypothetical protein HC256_008547 [Beauveria bassiana]
MDISPWFSEVAFRNLESPIGWSRPFSFIMASLLRRGLQFQEGGAFNIKAASHIKRTYGAI